MSSQLNKMTIVSICSLLEGFVLADKINKFFSFGLKKKDNFIVSGTLGDFMQYECFSSYLSKYRIRLLLIDNKEINGMKGLIGNSESTNFLLIIMGRDHNIVGQSFLSSLEGTQSDDWSDGTQDNFPTLFPCSIKGINWLRTNIIYPTSNEKQFVKTHLLSSIINYKEEVLLGFEEL